MKKLIPVLLPIIFFLAQSCEKDEYDDDQYGTTCFIGRASINNGPTTTFEYDQYDMISSISTFGGGIPNSKVDFTYNNNLAFADFYMDNQLLGHSIATLDNFSNVVSIQYTYASGEDAGELNYSYNSDHRPVSVSVFDFSLAKVETMNIEWKDGNATRFVSGFMDRHCEYKKGVKSTLRIGKGNVFLQAQFADANIAMFLSEDQMITYNAKSHSGEALNVTYDVDSDGKIRKIFWSTTSTNEFGTTEIEYDCHN